MRGTVKYGRTALIAATLAALLCGTARADLASSFGVYVYPTHGQTPIAQDTDEAQCYASAQSRTGMDPMASPPTAPPVAKHHMGLFRGGAGGAGAGAAIGAIAGNAGEGAAIGAVAGGLMGVRRQRREEAQAERAAQSNTNAAYQGGMSNFRTAFSACMTARGYVAQ